MPIFEYKGLNQKGKQVTGVKDADSARTLKAELRRSGVYLTQYTEQTAAGGRKTVVKGAGVRATGSRDVELAKWFQRIKLMEVAEMTRQFSTLIKAGIPVVDSLSALIAQIENAKFKNVLTAVRKAINEGAALGDALEAHPRVFTNLYVNMVRAGESSGTLDTVLSRLSDFLESQVKLKTKVTGTMVYPIIMVFVTAAIISILMIFVIPKMTEIFLEMGKELPVQTRVLIAVSDFFVGYWWLAGAMGAGALYYFRRWKRTKSGLKTWDGLKLRMPIFGSLFRMIAVSRFAKTLATLLQSGVPLLSAINIVRAVVDNEVIGSSLDAARDAIREGHGISGPLERSGQFPPMVTHMIAIGERTGELEGMLENVSNSYEIQVDAKVNTLTTVLEPVMIVIMGVIVGSIVFAVLSPMLQMGDLGGM